MSFPRQPAISCFALVVLVLPGSVTAFSKGDTVPGYVMQVPYGSRADVRTTARYEEGRGWSVTFRRKLDTGDPAHDVVFAKGGTYAFQVTTFDNGGGKEDLSHTTQDSGKVFTMGVPMEAGDLVFSEKPARLSELRGKLLASDEIEITASWTDPTRNDRRGEWTYGSGGWVKSKENEDRIAFLWDMQNDDFVSAGTCASMCHGNLHATAPGTKVDNWHWKASRSHPIGYADEQWWYDGVAHNGNGRRDDPGVGTAVENVLENGHPKYMAEGDPGTHAKSLFLLQSAAVGMKEAVAYSEGTWADGIELAGYIMRPPTGSRADVRTTARYEEGRGWSVTFRRKLDTGDPAHDIVFAKGGTYAFQVTTFDNGGGKEDLSHTTQDSGKVFTMGIPMEAGDLVFSEKPARLSELRGKLLASDEIEITASWTDPTRNDRRGEWTYGSGGWVVNGAEKPRIDGDERIPSPLQS